MQRRRDIAAAPQRSASDTWTTIGTMVADTLDRSPLISRSDVEQAMATAAGVGRMLVAGGHLRNRPLVLVAPPIHLSIYTVDGPDALGLEENTDPVPGGSTAETWTLHLPTPDPHQDTVSQVAAKHAHLSADPAPTESTVARAAATVVPPPAFDKAGLLRRDPNR